MGICVYIRIYVDLCSPSWSHFPDGPEMAWRPSCSSLDHRGPQESSSGSCSGPGEATDPKKVGFKSETKQEQVLKMKNSTGELGKFNLKRTWGWSQTQQGLTNKHWSLLHFSEFLYRFGACLVFACLLNTARLGDSFTNPHLEHWKMNLPRMVWNFAFPIKIAMYLGICWGQKPQMLKQTGKWSNLWNGWFHTFRS